MNTFTLVPKDGVIVTDKLKAEIKLAEGIMNVAFQKAHVKKQVYDIVCAVSIGNLTEDQAIEQINLLNIDD